MESYYPTSVGSPHDLVAPLDAGDYELWYAAGQDDKKMASQPIHVKAYKIEFTAPDTVKPGQTFKVKWKGPNGPSDYITIVLASAEAGEYGDYFFTADANPGSLTAPTKQGRYEIRYQSDRVGNFVFGYVAITVIRANRQSSSDCSVYAHEFAESTIPPSPGNRGQSEA